MVGLVAGALLVYWRHTAGELPAVVPLGLVACAGTVLLILGVDILSADGSVNAPACVISIWSRA